MGLIWQPWSSVSQGSSTPGAPIAAVPWEDSFALFILDPNGGIYAIKATPGYGWEAVPGGSSRPGAPITALFNGSGFTLFMADVNGEIFTTSGAPYQGWQPWTSVSEGSSAPGASVAAVPWEDSFALFISDPNGGIYAIKATPGYGWEAVPGRSSRPGAPITALFNGSGFTLFMADVNGEIFTTSGAPYQGWQPWTPVSEGSSTPGAPVAAIPWEDSFALFISDPNGGIYAIKATPGYGWELVPGRSSKPGGQITIVYGTATSPGSVFAQQQFLLFMVDVNGEISFTSGFPYQSWDPWTSVPGLSSVAGAGVTVVPQVFGSGSFAVFSSLTTFVADSGGEVNGTSTPPPVILFESNFESTTAGQLPSAIQAMGTATFNGPNVVITPTFPNTGNWLQIGPLSQDGGQFSGIFNTAAAGLGVYFLSTMMFMSSTSAEAYIAFSSNDPFLTLLFSDNNQVLDAGLQPTGCTFPRDQPFLVQVTITVGTTSATAQIGVDGTIVNYALPAYPSSFSSVSFGQQNPGGSGFDVTDVVMTYTAS